MSQLMWGLVSLVLGLALVLLEIFIPSHGILGFLALSALITSLVLSFGYSVPAGISVLGVMMVGLPVVVVLGFQWFPYTPFGRRVMLSAPEGDEVSPDESYLALRELVGQVGQAKTMMLPSGAVQIHGRSVDAVSLGIPIEAGQLVRVVEVRGNRVVVAPVEESTILDETAAASPKQPADDDLSRPIESLGIDPFDHPLN